MRHTALLLAVSAGLALTACGPVNRGLESVHQPEVSRTDYVLDVAAGPAGLAPGESERLAGWFDSLKLGYGDRVAVDDPSPYGHPGTRDAVAEVAARYGLLVRSDAPVTSGAIPANAVRIVVSRAMAEVPGCPDWSRDSQPEFAASTMSNYGCATNSNLAAMMADPQDLIRGQEGDAGGSNALVASKAIATYRAAEPTGKNGLKKEITGMGGSR